MKCQFCNTALNRENDGMFIRQFLNDEELKKLKVSNVCVSCKKEIMFAGLMQVL